MTKGTKSMSLEEEFALFYHELGLAFSQWARVEFNLGLLMQRCMDPLSGEVAYHSFRAIENFRSKIMFAREMISRTDNGKKIKDRALNLLNIVETQSQDRNKIAHGIVMTYPKYKPGRRICIASFTAEPSEGQMPKPPKDAKCIEQLNVSKIRYQIVGIKIHELYSELNGATVQPLIQPLTDIKPETFANLRSRMREVFPHLSES